METSRRPLDSLILALSSLRGVDQDMPVPQALSLLLIAKDEGLTLKDLARKAGVGMASASRYVSAFGRPSKAIPKGYGLVAAVENPNDRREKVITLTPKGRTFVNKLIGA